jgi:hypothetical protein
MIIFGRYSLDYVNHPCEAIYRAELSERSKNCVFLR